MNTEKSFVPPKEFTHNKLKYTFKETKNVNSKGEKLSEECHWYLVGGKLEPLTRGNIENLMK